MGLDPGCDQFVGPRRFLGARTKLELPSVDFHEMRHAISVENALQSRKPRKPSLLVRVGERVACGRGRRGARNTAVRRHRTVFLYNKYSHYMHTISHDIMSLSFPRSFPLDLSLQISHGDTT